MIAVIYVDCAYEMLAPSCLQPHTQGRTEVTGDVSQRDGRHPTPPPVSRCLRPLYGVDDVLGKRMELVEPVITTTPGTERSIRLRRVVR